jgi:hypothetical protein
MTTPASKIGAATAGSSNTTAAVQSKPSKLGSKFDVYVYPKVACRLEFQVFRRSAGSNYHCDKHSFANSRPITKLTVLHVTLPADTVSYKILYVTNNARNFSTSFRNETGRYSSHGDEVFEYQCSINGTRCEARYFDPNTPDVKEKFAKAEEQTISNYTDEQNAPAIAEVAGKELADGKEPVKGKDDGKKN